MEYFSGYVMLAAALIRAIDRVCRMAAHK